MDILTKALWTAAIIFLIGVGLTYLPNGTDYPFPTEIITATETLWSWLYSLNSIFPVDTLGQVLFLSIVVEIFVKLIWPVVMYIFNKVTGSVT